MESRQALVAEDSVSLEWIERTFDGAFMHAVDRLDNILWIKGKRLTLQVRLAADRKAICLVFVHSLVPGADLLRANIAANNCNIRFGWGRFWINQTQEINQHHLYADFTLLYERGIVPFHLIKSFEVLELVALKGIEAEFMDLVP